MGINYNNLFHLLIDKKMTAAQLANKAGFSANVITRIRRNEYVSLETIESICRILECSPNEILEFVKGK